MATRITDRAVKIADADIAANGYRAIVWQDTQVGARVGVNYPDRFWLRLISPAGKRTTESTTRGKLAKEWLAEIAKHGTPR